MVDKLVNIFKKIKEVEPPAHLYGRIIDRISLNLERKRLRKIFFLYTLSFLSTVASVMALANLVGVIKGSEFYSYLSLISTDSGIVFSNLNDFGVTLLESAPIFGMTLFVSLTFVSLLVLSLTVKNYKPKISFR